MYHTLLSRTRSRLRSTSSFAFLALSLVAFAGCDSGGSDVPNESPVARFSFSPDGARAGTVVAFANQSSDADGQIETYSWDFDGDGVEDDNRRNPNHTFNAEGAHTVTLTVADDAGSQASNSQTVNVGARFTSVRVTAVVIEEMPFTNSQGRGWDLTTSPDVYYTIYDENDELILAKDIYYEDLTPAELPVGWDEDLLIESLNQKRAIVLWDYDATNSDDVIGGIQFTLEGMQGDYPRSTTLDANGIRMRLGLKWEHSDDAASSAKKQSATSSQESLAQEEILLESAWPVVSPPSPAFDEDAKLNAVRDSIR